jgi:hypothetical protein
LSGARHTVISPAEHELEEIRKYCSEKGISIDKVNFIVGMSQHVLPNIELPELDLLLIDGLHGFPAPYIDWFYTAAKIKIGGFLVVDDVWLWSCQILSDFLQAQPEWKLVGDFPPRTTIFKKLAEGSEYLEWTEQPYVARNGSLKFIDGELQFPYQPPPKYNWNSLSTDLRRTLGHLKKGEVRELAKKAARRIRN